MSAKLSDQVVDKRRRCIDLRDQRGGLTASVLESLRAFLRHNDFYIHLSVSDNLLNSEALAELCSLVKRHPYLASIEAQHCGLQDKDFCFYVAPALISMQRLTFIDLSRNSGLTDNSAEMVARILLETEVESLRLIGTSLTVAGGRLIADAAANTTSLVSCELPYTVGNVVLDAVDAHTRRNRAHRERLTEASTQYARLQVRHCQLPSVPGLKRLAPAHLATAGLAAPLESEASTLSLATPLQQGGSRVKSIAFPKDQTPGVASEDRQWRACVSKGRRLSWVRPDPAAAAAAAAVVARDGLTPPLSSASSTPQSTPATISSVKRTAPSPFPLSPPSSLTRRAKATPDTLESVTMWDWADPAMSNTLRCLFVLDHQAQVLDQSSAASPSAAALHDVARRSKGRSSGRSRSSARRGSDDGRPADNTRLPPLWSP